MSGPLRRKALLIRVNATDPHWWWPLVDHEALDCELVCWSLPLAGGRPTTPFSRRFILMAIRTARLLVRARRQRFTYVFTFENDWLTFLIAAFQTAFLFRRPRHVVLQFIMREKQPTLASRVKYAFMHWCFRSVWLCVCSSRLEADYYRRTFRWPPEKLAFVPLHTDPAFADRPVVTEEPFALAAGRTFRDYSTLLEAATRGLSLPLTIVAGHANLNGAAPSASVSVQYDIPLNELLELMARASMIVLPLQERQISIGQSVLLEAMAMGKPVVVTRVNGTIDYVDHMRTGLLVPPGDAAALREAINLLAEDAALRRRIGAAGREEVSRRFLPNHYAQGVALALRGLR